MKLLRKNFLSKTSGALYTAMFDRDTGAHCCNCPGWCFKRKGKPRACKHVRMLATEARRGLSVSVLVLPGRPHPANETWVRADDTALMDGVLLATEMVVEPRQRRLIEVE